MTNVTYSKEKGVKWKLLALVSTALLLMLIAIFSYSHFATFPWGVRPLDSPSIVLQIRQLKQLVTVRYSLQRVVGITEPKEPFGSESILLMVGGEALAGVELDEVRSAALNMGILDQAQRSAETALKDCLAALGMQAQFERHSA